MMLNSRTGVVDGKKVVFELVTNVTQKPKSSREERVSTRHEMVNSHRSPLEQRIRFWLMHFSVLKLSVTFLGAFIGMCVVFAGFFFSLPTGCCGDPEMPFTDTFAFSVQTATTIGRLITDQREESVSVFILFLAHCLTSSITVGYGSLGPVGMTSNFLVVMISYGAILMNTLFAGMFVKQCPRWSKLMASAADLSFFSNIFLQKVYCSRNLSHQSSKSPLVILW